MLEISRETIVFCYDEYLHRLLLGLKVKKGGFGEGLFNGYGGKCLPGESFGECAVREIFEEARMSVQEEDLIFVGILCGHDKNKIHLCHVFLVKKWFGIPRKTEEMEPYWFSVNELPWRKTHISDQDYIPRILLGEKVFVYVDISCLAVEVLPLKGTRVKNLTVMS